MKLNRRTFFKLIGAAVATLSVAKHAEAKPVKKVKLSSKYGSYHKVRFIDPKILFVDVASYGNKSTIIQLAVGSEVVGVMALPKGIDLFETERIVENYIKTQQPTFTCVHAIGLGMGLYEILNSKIPSVIGVSKFSRSPYHRELAKFFDKKNNSVAPGKLIN